MSSNHVYARNGNIKGIQDEINRDPNVVNDNENLDCIIFRCERDVVGSITNNSTNTRSHRIVESLEVTENISNLNIKMNPHGGGCCFDPTNTGMGCLNLDDYASHIQEIAIFVIKHFKSILDAIEVHFVQLSRSLAI